MTDDNSTVQGQDQTPPDANDGGQQSAGAGDKTLTQEQFNVELDRRVARERAKYADYAELQKKAEELDELKQSQLSELEQERHKREQAEQAALKAQERANQTLIRAAFVGEASKLGVKNPEDAYALADRSAVAIDDSGLVSGVTEAVKAIVEAGRLPLATPRAPNLDGGAGASGQGAGSSVKLSADQEDVARKMGLTPEQYAKGLLKDK